MGASPFSTYEEFYESTGPIYTFADRPAIIGILTVLSALIFVYFIYATNTMKKGGDAGASMKGLMGLLLASSVLPIADAVYNQYIQRSDHRPTVSMVRDKEEAIAPESGPMANVQPLALLGMLGTGAGASLRRKRKSQRLAGPMLRRNRRMR